MQDDSFNESILNSEEDSKAFIKWFLRASILDVQQELETEEAHREFLEQRERRLMVQLDDLNKITFSSAIPCKQEGQIWFRIVKDVHLITPPFIRGIKNKVFEV